MSVPTGLPSSLSQRAVQLPGLPEDDVAWSKDDAHAVLTALDGWVVAVLQADAYFIPFGQQEVIHTGRRASYVYQLGERALEFALRSRHAAAEFIDAGAPEELFVLLFSDQDDADAGYGTVAVKAG